MMQNDAVSVFVSMNTAVLVYLAGVAIGLIAIDARGFRRLGLALLWPVGPLAFVVTISILLLSLPIAFPVIGSLVLAALVAAAVLTFA